MDSAVSTVIEPRRGGGDVPEEHELANLEVQIESGQQTPVAPSTAPLSAASSQVALRAALDDGLNVQELAPVDRGVKAWTFCACSFALEMMIWGYCFRWVASIDSCPYRHGRRKN